MRSVFLLGLLVVVSGCDGEISDLGRAAPPAAGTGGGSGSLATGGGGEMVGDPGGGTGGGTAMTSGTGGGAAGGTVQPVACVPAPALSPDAWATFRQLTRAEHLATSRALAGVAVDVFDSLPSDGETRAESGVPSNARMLMDDQRLSTFAVVAKRVSQATVANLQTQKHCVVTAARSTGTCLDTWLGEAGARAFRRPLTADEKNRLATLNKGEPDPVLAAGMVIEALMLSPQFLFHVELGEAATGARVALTPQELAARLAYFVTGAPPPAALADAAAQGQLKTDAQLGQWVKTLLNTPAGKANQTQQVMAFLAIDNLEKTQKSPALFPEFTAALKASMKLDAQRSIESELLSGSYGVSDWLKSDRRYYGTELTGFYEGKGALRRVGPLMQPAWLAKHSGGQSTSPTRRGKFITERLLCEHVPPPPQNVVIPPIKEDDGTLTTRERFESHGQLPCATACHRLMDPMGFALESYDPIGRYRDTENNKPVNTTGTVKIQDVSGAFADGADLVSLLGNSTAFTDCFTEQWVERALAVAPRPDERCETQDAAAKLRAQGGKFEVLLVEIAKSPMFRTKGVCVQ